MSNDIFKFVQINMKHLLYMSVFAKCREIYVNINFISCSGVTIDPTVHKLHMCMYIDYK